MQRGIFDGSVAPEDAQAQLKDRVGAIVQSQTEGLAPMHSAAVRTALLSQYNAVSRQLGDTAFKYKQSQTAATLDQMGLEMQQTVQARGPEAVANSYNAILDFTGAAAGFTPAQIEAKKQDFRERTATGYFDEKGASIMAAREYVGITPTLTNLTDTLHEVMGPAGAQLDPVTRGRITTQLVGFQNRVLAEKATADANTQNDIMRKQNAAADALNAAQTVVLNGAYLSQDAIAVLSAATAGTPSEAPARQLLVQQTQIAGFATLPAAQRAAALEHCRSEGANPNVGTTPDNQKQIASLSRIDSAVSAAANDDPWKAAQTYGVITNAPVMAAGGQDDLLTLLDQRMQQIGQVEAWVGHKVSPLQPVEAQQLSDSLKMMPPAQAAQALSFVGQMVGDSDRIAAVAKQLNDKDGNFGLAMAYAGDRTQAGTLTAEYILRGAQALKDKTALVNESKQVGWHAMIADQIRGAFSSQQAEDQAIDAAFKIMAARDASGEASEDANGAVKMATGGIIRWGSAGGRIPLPIGVDESMFEDRIAAMTPDMFKTQAPDGNVYVGATAIPLPKFIDSLTHATLVHAGQGMYVVRAGNSFVTNNQRQRIVLKVNLQSPDALPDTPFPEGPSVKDLVPVMP